MSTLTILIKRNIKLFFKDKGMFFTSLVTPAILLVLYATFLGNTYRDSFVSAVPPGIQISGDLFDGLVGGQLVSSILAVSCVTVAFCSNFLMVQDKAGGNIRDLRISPVRSSVLSMSYFLATMISTMLICLAATAVCLGYLHTQGWYMAAADIAWLCLDVFLLVLFGTALSSVINFFLSTQGQISAVGAIISAGYGFICGAYMPIASFSSGLQKAISYLPGTYGTSLVREHSLRGVFAEMEAQGVPAEVTDGLREALDCHISLGGTVLSDTQKYLLLLAAIVILIAVYIALNALKKR